MVLDSKDQLDCLQCIFGGGETEVLICRDYAISSMVEMPWCEDVEMMRIGEHRDIVKQTSLFHWKKVWLLYT